LRSSLRRFRANHGFTLLEVLVATTVLFVGIASLAGLAMMATRANLAARTTTQAALLAAQKMEELRAGDGAGLVNAPGDALVRNTDGYCDFLDAAGRPLGGGPSPPREAVFVRRWSIAPLPSNPATALVLHVRVLRVAPTETGQAGSTPDEALFVSVRVRAGT
jgi:type II secretory pathway pseudopilin PulG